MARTGIHWSNYGALLALDSIIHFIESHRKIDLPDIILENIELSTKIQSPDNDIERGMNLIFPLHRDKMAIPHYKVNKEGKDSIRVMVIGDSFFWQAFGSGLAIQVFGDCKFLFYYQEIHPDYTKVENTDMQTLINKTDVIILLTTDANLPGFAWGFIDDTYHSLIGKKETVFNQSVRDYEKAIRDNPEWLELVKQKAIRKNIPLDSMIRLDAIYMVENQKNNQ
jgi:hypothetical protein